MSFPRKLDDEARAELEQIASVSAAIPSYRELAQKYKVSESLIKHVMQIARARFKLSFQAKENNEDLSA